MILAIDTSTDEASVALLAGETPIAEVSWLAAGNHSRSLERAVATLLSLASARVQDLTALAVAIGPGSFNGLRVGISYAKGLCVARGLPLTGASTLDVVAFQVSWSRQKTWAVISAGRGEVYAAHYSGTSDTWRRDGEYLRAQLDSIAAKCNRDDLIAGPAAEELAEAARDRGVSPSVVPPPASMRRASFLAELGRLYFQAGGPDQLDTLEPLYLRRSAAEEKRAALEQE